MELEREKESHELDQCEINRLKVNLEKAKRRATAGTQATLNSSYCLKQRVDLKTSGETVDDIFQNQDTSWDPHSLNMDVPFSNESSIMLDISNKSLDQVVLADEAAIKKLQKLAII